MTADRDVPRSLSLLDALFTDASIGLGLFDPDLRYVRVNDVLQAIIGVPADAALRPYGPRGAARLRRLGVRDAARGARLRGAGARRRVLGPHARGPERPALLLLLVLPAVRAGRHAAGPGQHRHRHHRGPALDRGVGGGQRATGAAVAGGADRRLVAEHPRHPLRAGGGDGPAVRRPLHRRPGRRAPAGRARPDPGRHGQRPPAARGRRERLAWDARDRSATRPRTRCRWR